MFKPILFVILSAALVTSAVASTYEVLVHGIVCEFCSYGVSKKVRKLSFVDGSRLNKGVEVDIEHQKVLVAVKPGAELDQGALFEAIESGGYKPEKIWEINQAGERIGIQP